MTAPVTIRLMTTEDGPAVLDMWVATWQAAYPAIDFTQRRTWAEDRFDELRSSGSCGLVAILHERIAGMVIINPQTGYLDQIAVAVDCQGIGVADALLGKARELSSGGIELHVNQDNARAIAFYRKHGFTVTGESTNPRSGAPIFRMHRTR